MKNAIIFGVMFLLIGPSTRSMLTGRLGAFGEWMGAWSPFSYLLIALVVAAPIAAVQLIVNAPKVVEEEDPLKKYLRESAPVDED